MNAKEIKKLRKKLKGPTGKPMTQTEFADALGVTKTTVLNWENEWSRPTKLAIRCLARMERKYIKCMESEK